MLIQTNNPLHPFHTANLVRIPSSVPNARPMARAQCTACRTVQDLDQYRLEPDGVVCRVCGVIELNQI